MSALEDLKNAIETARESCGKFSIENLTDVPNTKFGNEVFTTTEAIHIFEDLLQSVETSMENPHEIIKYIASDEITIVTSSILALSNAFSSRNYSSFVLMLDKNINFFRPFAMLSMEKMDSKRYQGISNMGSTLQEMETQTASAKSIVRKISRWNSNLKELLAANKQRAEDLEKALTPAQSNIAQIQELHKDAVNKNGEIKTTAESTQKTKDQLVAHEIRAETKNTELAEILEQGKDSLQSHKNEMNSQTQEAEKMIATAREALHLTTARGLSAAFDTQAQNLGRKNVKLAWLSFGVITSAIAGALGLWTLSNSLEWHNAFFRFLLMSISLGLSAFGLRQYSINKSLEHAYAFKSALVSSYPGFSEQLGKELGKEYASKLMLEILRDPQRTRNDKETTSSTIKLASKKWGNTDD